MFANYQSQNHNHDTGRRFCMRTGLKNSKLPIQIIEKA